MNIADWTDVSGGTRNDLILQARVLEILEVLGESDSEHQSLILYQIREFKGTQPTEKTREVESCQHIVSLIS